MAWLAGVDGCKGGWIAAFASDDGSEAPLIRVMHSQTRMRRFDFDPEAAVRLSWAGVPPVNLPAPVRYYQEGEGGVSHFKYLRDNCLLIWMNIRLVGGLLIRLPRLIGQRLRG